MIINVIGCGYIGLPTALMFAAHGCRVVATDRNQFLIDALCANRLTFEEKNLKPLFAQAIDGGIVFSTEYAKANVYIIALPTPYIKQSKKIDPSYIVDGIYDILPFCPHNSIIVVESTISPGTIDKYVRPILEKNGLIIGRDIHLAHAPERIIPGNMIYELKHNSRTIGADNITIGEKIKKLYATFCEGEIIVTDIRTAEMSKVVENTYRDVNIAFANELAQICRTANLDVYEIIRIANMHPRVNILQPGPGVGGHCISVDPWFLVGDYPNVVNLVRAARTVNDSMPGFVFRRICYIMKENGISDLARIGLYGLTYKEDVDDIRESPTLQLLSELDKNKADKIKVYDPMCKTKILDNQVFDFDIFLNNVDIVVIMVGHTHIRENKSKLNGKIILDTRNIFSNAQTYHI